MFSRNGFTSSRSYRDVVWCTLHSALAERELHKSELIEWVRTPSIPIIHLGDKTLLAAESKAVSKVLLKAWVLWYGNSLPFLLSIWKGKLKEKTATVDITVRNKKENTKGRTSCQPEISTNTHANRNKFNPSFIIRGWQKTNKRRTQHHEAKVNRLICSQSTAVPYDKSG